MQSLPPKYKNKQTISGQNSLLTVVDALAFLAATRKKVAFCAKDRQDKNILFKLIKNTKYDKAFEAKRTLLYLRKENIIYLHTICSNRLTGSVQAFF